jgi:hypothetical protein
MITIFAMWGLVSLVACGFLFAACLTAARAPRPNRRRHQLGRLLALHASCKR